MNICIRNHQNNEIKWFSILSNTQELKDEVEQFVNGQDFSIIDHSESTFKFKEIISLENLLTTSQIIKEIVSSNISVELIQKIAEYYGLLLHEALDFHSTNFIEENHNVEDFTRNYMLIQHDKAIAGLPPIVRENIDWQCIYETISVNEIISFNVKSSIYFYRR